MEEQNVTKAEDPSLKTDKQQDIVEEHINQDTVGNPNVSDNAVPEQAKKSPDRTKTLMSLIIAVLLVAIGVILYVFMNKKPEMEAERAGTGGVVITPDTHGKSGAMQKVAEGMITVKMAPEWYFYDGNSPGNGYVANSRHNTAPLKIIVTLDDTGEVVLETDPIPVGSCVENFALGKRLEGGTYPATVTHALVDEDGKITNSVRTQITIHVQN